MNGQITELLNSISVKLGLDIGRFDLAYPEDPEHGDLSTNIAMVNAKAANTSPLKLAEKIAAEINASLPAFVREIEIAGPGFINLKFKDEAFTEAVVAAAAKGIKARAPEAAGGKVLVEYTDPNTFKAFHIGHLMSNAIGESLSRLFEFSGSKVVRICYPSDIGLHIAKSIWAVRKNIERTPKDGAPIAEKTEFLGKMYVEGTKAYEADPASKPEIDSINKSLYEKSNKAIMEIYEKGRAWSLEHFEQLYGLLGTKFDEFIYESDMAPAGLEIVRAHIGKAFEESEGAIVYKGEKRGLHTRVFVSSQGLPTYEAKELGLNMKKFWDHPDAEKSVIVTASEQNDYFRVLKEALKEIDPKVGEKTVHIGHGMMRFASGKMSSRTGNVVTAESLIGELTDMAAAKMAERRFSPEEAAEIAGQIAVAAVKYTVLRSSVGSDIVFDSVASISFEGDSGPYLQYSAVRASSVLEKAGPEGRAAAVTILPEKVGQLERLIVRFPEVALRAARELSPQRIAGHLISLASAFNSFYAGNQILSENEPLSPYRIALTRAFLDTMTEGLWLLGIKVPKRM